MGGKDEEEGQGRRENQREGERARVRGTGKHGEEDLCGLDEATQIQATQIFLATQIKPEGVRARMQVGG